MQCELFKLLLDQPGFKDQYKIFVEPRLTDEKLKSVIPDFLIILQNEKKVVAAVELKYVPHSYSEHTKDLNTLIGFYRVFNDYPEHTFPLVTDPKTGLWRGEKFQFDKNLTLIFCVITRVDAWVITHHDEIWKRDDDSIYGPMNYLQYVGAIPANDDEDWRQVNLVPPSGV